MSYAFIIYMYMSYASIYMYMSYSNGLLNFESQTSGQDERGRP